MKLPKLTFLAISICISCISCTRESNPVSNPTKNESEILVAFSDSYNNPIFTQSDSPNNPYLGVASSFILRRQSTYQMWYTNWNDGKRFNVQYAESDDGLNWKSVQIAPVLSAGNLGEPDSYGVYGGPVFYEDSFYKMFYTGISGADNESYIGLATSNDGLHWTKQANPIIKESGKKYAAQSFLKVGNLYILYYSYTKINYQWGISIATSNDGNHWTQYAEDVFPITEYWELPGPHFPSVIQFGNGYIMLYGSLSNMGFGLATSSDGLHWHKANYNPVITSQMTRSFWSSQLRYPFMTKFENGYRLYYTGMKNNGTLAIGCADLIIK